MITSSTSALISIPVAIRNNLVEIFRTTGDNFMKSCVKHQKINIIVKNRCNVRGSGNKHPKKN